MTTDKNTTGRSTDDEDAFFERASKAYARSLEGTAATPAQPSRTASGFVDINVYELRNVRGVLARFNIEKGDRLRRVEE